MKYYMVEYTAWTTGREFGHPYRTKTVGTDKMAMLKLMKEKMTDRRTYRGWDEPEFFEFELVGKMEAFEAIEEFDKFEREKVIGEGI